MVSSNPGPAGSVNLNQQNEEDDDDDDDSSDNQGKTPIQLHYKILYYKFKPKKYYMKKYWTTNIELGKIYLNL